ncbi:MAG TPA: oligosaccharide flippase family protein [Bacteroidales bacterium]|nr:oligosaccharide flippase family protein [Bacteroidales bacterium]HSA43531.1 oligosaccharide flippase family protein [Bacteroidales bacterium]
MIKTVLTLLLKKDILTYFTGKTIPALVNLLLIILALRWLGKETYGQYSLIYYMVILVSTFTFGWLQQSILRFLSQYQLHVGLAVMRFLLLTLLSSAIGTLAIALIGLLYFHLPLSDTLVLMFTLIFYNLLLFRMTVSQAQFKPLQYVFTEGLYNILMLACFVFLVVLYKRSDYLVLFIAMLAGLITASCLVPGMAGQVLPALTWSKAFYRRDFTRKMFSYGIMLSVWLSISYMLNIANRFFIKEFTNYEAVGIFSSVYDIIFKISGFACMPVLLTYHPRITAFWNEGNESEARREVGRALGLEAVIFVAVLIVFMSFRPWFYDQVLQLDEPGLGPASFALILAAFLWQAGLLLQKGLELMLKLKKMIIALLIALGVNTLGNLFLIPAFGYKAAAWSTLIGVIVYLILVAVWSKTFLRRNFTHA